MRLQRPRFSSKPEPDRAQDPCTARIGSIGNITSTQQCPNGIQLDIGHSQNKQGKYNSAYSIDFVVYTCPRNATKNAMLYAVVSSLAATLDTRWRAWTGGL
ncbi:hypothetical protein TIFTF001_028151 [Ficus carica]|uniref:Uncharacterized protein n=1 Tax=Ficus carica TaxID=3494 RepID=A0AA88IW47_FICCA|nr:hypothetical protein TIFTF001_028151 [Ficus carica]